MLNFNWEKNEITGINDIHKMVEDFKNCQPIYSGFDTETTGLHIKEDKPFVISFGFVNPETKEGYTYVIDLETMTHTVSSNFIDVMYRIAKKTKKFVATNTKFDLHMMANIDHEYPFENLTDLQIMIRLAHDAIPKVVPLALKQYATRFVDPRAKHSEKKLKDEAKKIKQENTRKLKTALGHLEIPEKYKVTGTEKRWTMKMIDTFLSDKLNEISDLPEDVQLIFETWKEIMPNPNQYTNYNRANLIDYAHYDVIYMLEAFVTTYDVAITRGQEATIDREERLIKPLYRMERAGYLFNMDYALNAKETVKDYIKQQRAYLEKLAGEPIKVGQHKRIKILLQTKFDLRIEETGKNKLKQALAKTPNKKAEAFIKVVIELRTLEKWYSTYICHWIDVAKKSKDNRVYTSYKQAGAVSGRVSSNFQQFPGKDLEDYEGKTLFTPRKMFMTTPGYSTYYFDYSGMEVRLQALYTIAIMGGDENLCRIYIPFGLDAKDWIPGDLHNITTEKAFGITPDNPNFQKLRKKAKGANFALIYGASVNTLMFQFGFDEETATALYTAFYDSFPGVAVYADWVKKTIWNQGYVENMLGRRYYGVSAHNGRNYLIQGTGADYTKEKLIEVDRLLTPYKSYLQGYVHDELSAEIAEGEEFLIYRIKEIMEEWEGSPITLEVDVEISKTTWDAKKVIKC